jgi:hypothetical protein
MGLAPAGLPRQIAPGDLVEHVLILHPNHCIFDYRLKNSR